jgi:DNA-binding transcriptional LysR family regulator
MNNRQLESFLSIAQLGSFAAAAERLHVTQSTISARIQELEEDLGVQLFDRSQRQVHLTLKGRELLAYAEEVSRLFTDIKQKIGSSSSLTGTIRVGVAELVAITWLPQFARSMSEQFPGINIEFEVGLNPFLLDGVRQGALDLALIAGPSTDSTFASAPLGVVEFAWMSGPAHEAGTGVLEAHDLRKWPIIYQGTDSYTSKAANDWLGLAVSRQQRGTYCNSLAAVKSLTAAGVGVSLLPVDTFADSIAKGELYRLSTKPAAFEMPFTVIYSKGEPSSQLFERIAGLCVEASTFKRVLGK